MMAWVLIVIGALLVLIGVIGWITLLLLPVHDEMETLYDKDKDVIQAKTDPVVKQVVEASKRCVRRYYNLFIFVGIVLFWVGFYFGYASQGESFWLYKKMFPDRISGPVLENINEEGQYVAEDGRGYTYYILVDGENIELSGQKCADLEDLKSKLAKLHRENTVIIIDSFAVSSLYHAIKDFLKELGMDYKEM